MKKTLLTMALVALASTSSFAATLACNGTTTIAALVGNDCVISNNGNTWTLAGFLSSGLGGATPSVTQPDVAVTASMFTINVQQFNSGGQFGFSVTVAPVAGNLAAESLFRLSNNRGTTLPNSLISSQFETQFRIIGNSGSALITRIGTSLNNPTLNLGTNDQGGATAAIQLDKFVGRLNNLNEVRLPQRVDLSSLPGTAMAFTSGSPFSNALIANPGDLFVVDRFDGKGGNWINGNATVSGYTNYFLPAAPIDPIPEPMTFALMGAGLVGLAVMRRRK